MWESCSEKMVRKTTIEGNITIMAEELKKNTLEKSVNVTSKKKCAEMNEVIVALYAAE